MTEKGLIYSLGALVGVPEDALRLLIGMLLAYPVSILYINSPIRYSSANYQHLYFCLTGISIAWWTIDKSCVIHHLVCILVTFITLKLFKSSKLVVPFNFFFHLTYLNIGYFLNDSFGPTIAWTTPHCVLCLRLIGIACDVHDGTIDNKKTDEDNKAIRNNRKNSDALKDLPSMLEMISYVFYLPSYFVGPQFSMAKYRSFIQRNLQKSDTTGSFEFGINRCGLGFLYLGLNVIGSWFVPIEYVSTAEFLESESFLKQSLYFVIWIKAIFAKYMGVWLLADGSVAISGLGYNGRERTDWKISWDGVVNVKPWKYENCGKFMDLVENVNITTNLWCKNYVYKRCMKAGFKTLSHVFTMLFLAVWHGLCSGYFLCFFFELFPISFEKQIIRACDNNPKIKRTVEQHVWMKDVFSMLGKLYFLFFFPHCLVPFVLIRFESYMPILWSTKCLVLTIFGSWFVLQTLVEKLCKMNYGSSSIPVNGEEKKSN